MLLRSFRATLTSIALLLALPACAQSSPTQTKAAGDADPALWVVKDADTTVYLFGTIHVLKPGLSWFDEAVKTAFDKSGELVLEMVQPDPAAMQQIVATTGINPTGPTLTEQLPEAKRPAYLKALTEAGLPSAAFDRMKPWLAAVSLSLMPIQKLGYDASNGPETVLASAAKSANKPVIGLETAEQQIGYFNGLSQPAQMQFLVSTVDELPEAGKTMATMVDNWSHGDPEALAKTMNESLKDSPEVAKVLLTERNARWAKWIANRMNKPGTVFVAVGAGHLAGPDSVQAQLARAGVKAERVAY
ncbi:TraB/GumN family protein [Sphingomonas carotinifaciens]|uniref:TraB/GumN family protein n=1 Tax=Sphingomonas carotinifaciens TaxID=1166323 RepID=UPI0039A3F6B6